MDAEGAEGILTKVMVTARKLEKTGQEEGAKKPAKKAAAPKKASHQAKSCREGSSPKGRLDRIRQRQQEIETFPFNQKAEAEASLPRKSRRRKGTFYLNLVKEPIEE